MAGESLSCWPPQRFSYVATGTSAKPNRRGRTEHREDPGTGGDGPLAIADVFDVLRLAVLGDHIGDQHPLRHLVGGRILRQPAAYRCVLGLEVDAAILYGDVETQRDAEFIREIESRRATLSDLPVLVDAAQLNFLNFREVPECGKGFCPRGLYLVTIAPDRNAISKRLLFGGSGVDGVHQFCLVRSKGAVDQFRMLETDLVEYPLHFSVLEREADDSPGEPGAVEIADDFAEAVLFEVCSELQRACAQTRRRQLGEGGPFVEGDRAGCLRIALALPPEHGFFGIGAEDSVDRLGVETEAAQRTLHLPDRFTAYQAVTVRCASE